MQFSNNMKVQSLEYNAKYNPGTDWIDTFFKKLYIETLEAILQEFEVLLFAVMCRVPWALKIQKHGARMIKNVAPYDTV